MRVHDTDGKGNFLRRKKKADGKKKNPRSATTRYPLDSLGLDPGALLALGREKLEHEESPRRRRSQVSAKLKSGHEYPPHRIEVQEVDDLAEANAIDEVADGAAENEAECERRKSIPGGEVAKETE